MLIKLLALSTYSLSYIFPVAPPTTPIVIELGSASTLSSLVKIATPLSQEIDLSRFIKVEIIPTPTITPTTTTSPPAPTFTCPIQGPVKFGNSYGEPRAGHVHIGIDMTVPWGTPVVAPVAGYVSYAADYLGGNAFYLEGVDGITYYGAHLSKYGLRGDVVMGDIIGYVGQTGDAASPHLHLEMHPGGIFKPSINPFDTLVQYCIRI